MASLPIPVTLRIFPSGRFKSEMLLWIRLMLVKTIFPLSGTGVEEDGVAVGERVGVTVGVSVELILGSSAGFGVEDNTTAILD